MTIRDKAGVLSDQTWYALAATRMLLGSVFLWAFLDKMFGLGMATPAYRAWINMGSPTAGFLGKVDGPFAALFHGLNSFPLTDGLFMLGLLSIGVALILGVAVRLAAVSGVILLGLMWMASLPLSNNPIIDDHVIYILVLVVVALALPAQRVSLADKWQQLKIVKANEWLK